MKNLHKLTALLVLPLIVMVGCSQNTLAVLVTTLGNAAASVAAIEGNPTLSAKLKTDTAAASTAVLNWKQGTPAQNVIQALNLVETDLNMFISVSPTDAALIALAVSTVQSILQIVSPSVTPATAHVSIGVTNKKDFVKHWNAIVAKDPARSSLKL